MTYNNTFKHALIGDVFQMNKYDLTKWVKVSNRTAKLIENNRRYYFNLNENILTIK